MSLKNYLEKHFVDKPTFALLADISEERLDQLIEAGAVPAATYICDGRSVRSTAFGTTDVLEPVTGQYFRPECVRWVRIADQAPAGSEKAAVETKLKDELRAALSASGFLNPADATAVETRVQAYLPSFFNGTFGLCVADPSTGSGIVRKEMLQERLTAITDNGSNPSPSEISRSELLRLIDDYAGSAMPFSPAEYALSSRRRLVDDLRSLVAKAQEIGNTGGRW